MSLLASLGKALLTLLQVAAVIVPLTVTFQVLRDRPWVRRRLGPYAGSLRRIGLGEGAAVGLAAGVFLGIVYGAGILIQESRSGRMSAREIFLLSLFLCTCHAVVEDTLLFAVLGGHGGWILGPRVILAVAGCALLGRLLPARGRTRSV
ncbi:MAG: nucleoside recognition protein [Candidatus Dadabacteria bacterium]|nr:MAG: nucleoside recognition protein [Candidatus Dadabacteria bacterium]